VHRGLERQTGTGGGFKEAARDHFVLQQLGLWVGLQFCRGIQNQFQLFAAEVIDGNDVFLIERVSHVYLLTPGQKKSPSIEGLGMGDQRKEKRQPSVLFQTR